MEDFPKKITTKQAVIATLAYFDLFGIPLTRAEVSEYLFLKEPDEQKIDIYLRESPLIRLYDGYYSLQQDDVFYRNFFKKMDRTKAYWRRVKKFQWLFSICPYVELVSVCNSLPIRDTRENSDIDLLIITKSKRLFTARFFLTLFTQLFLVRRHGKKISKRFCLSFYLSEDRVDLTPIRNKPFDLYLAYWLKTLQPISGSYDMYEKLIDANSNWIKEYFHARLPHKKRFFRKRSEKQAKWNARLEDWFSNEKWEARFKKWQLERAREKSKSLSDTSGTIIKEDILKFHDHDARESIRLRWTERINNLL